MRRLINNFSTTTPRLNQQSAVRTQPAAKQNHPGYLIIHHHHTLRENSVLGALNQTKLTEQNVSNSSVLKVV